MEIYSSFSKFMQFYFLTIWKQTMLDFLTISTKFSKNKYEGVNITFLQIHSDSYSWQYKRNLVTRLEMLVLHDVL